MKIEIDSETADVLVLAVLKDSYEYLNKDIEELCKKRSLKDYEAQDLGHFIKFRNSMSDVIEYYGGFLDD